MIEKEITKVLKRVSKNKNIAIEEIFEEFLEYCFCKAKGVEGNDYNPVYDDLFFEAWDAMKRHPRDIYGEVWHYLGLYEKYKGEFYVPYEISSVISKLSFNEKEEKLKQRKTLSILDGACGSGAVLIAFISYMLNGGYDINRVYFYGNDNNLQCIKMAYIQLYMLGANASLTHYDNEVDKVYELYELTQQKTKKGRR